MDKPIVTVDACIFTNGCVLLVQRKNDPFKDHWALPGGHVNKEECLLDAAYRELNEETGVTKDDLVSNLQQVHTFDEQGRDPRGWVISVLHVGVAPPGTKVRADDDAKDARWFPLNDLPALGFDHENMIKKALSFKKIEAVYNRYIESRTSQ